MAPNLSVPLGATGGTAPYVYSVIPGGAGGTIDPVSGVYTSPNNTGIDTVEVTDSLGATATGDIAVNYPLSLVADIIQTAMGLGQGQVYLWDQKINIPKDSRLYIAVSQLTCRPFGNHVSYNGSGSMLIAIQAVNMYAQVTIDILSRGPDARDRKEQVLLALSSPYAQQQMELNSFYVAPLSTAFVNLSQIDGAAIPMRYQITVGLQYFSQLITNPPYYDSFTPPTVTDEP